MKITKQQVKDCYENKELLKEYFPDVFKPILEVGKWYKGCYNFGGTWLFYFNGNYNSGVFPMGYGFDVDNNWRDHNQSWGYTNLKEATLEEVEKALISEAEKIGFKEGVKYRSPTGRFTRITKTPFYLSFDMSILLCSNGDAIMGNGKWVEIIVETEIELTLDQIAEKFGVDKVKIKKE